MSPVNHRIPGLVLLDRHYELPLDHDAPDGASIDVYAREAVSIERRKDRLPWLVYLQGGPGYPSPRPMGNSGWIRRVTRDYRLLLLDQRGTGRSTPVSFQTLTRLGGAAEQTAYLRHFRADSIVKDCEMIRRELLPRAERWTLLGQSFGGFCSVHYLSAAPEGLAGVLMTGGLPPLEAHPDDVYRRTYALVLERNRRYYGRYPDDVERIQAVAKRLERGDVRLPSGDLFSPRRLQLLGLQFGFSDGAELVHYLFESAWVPGRSGEELSYSFLRGFENLLSFDTNPIFSLLHEACYGQGFATNWSAQRVRAEFAEFDAARVGEGEPLFFTGEMIYPWMFDEFGTLAPLKEAAELLARAEDWPRLYDPGVLARNEVPCAAAVYHDDMYVEREYSLETSRAIQGAKVWVTNEYEHNGLRANGERVVGRLLELLEQ